MVENKKKIHFYAQLCGLSALMVAPLLFMVALKWPKEHDLIFYAAISKEFSAQFWGGQLYPRWLMQLNAGFGSPVFLYYSPLAFYLLAPLQWLAPFDPNGLARVVLGMGAALVVAGITSYHWLRGHFDETQARKGALLYAAFPYMPIIIYYNYGLASLWAIAFFPLALRAIDRLQHDGWRGVPRLAIALALICLAHMVSLITFLIVPPTYLLVTAPRGARVRHCLYLATAALLAMALCAVYLLPAQLNQPYIYTELFQKGIFLYSDHFWMMHSLFGFFCFIVPLLGLCVEQPKGSRFPRLVTYWAVITGLLFFMVTPLSKPVWALAPYIQRLQFPMRFYLGMLPGAVFVATYWLQRAKTRLIYPFLLLAMLALTVCNSWDSWFSDNDQLISGNPFIAMGANHVFQPRWVVRTEPTALKPQMEDAAIPDYLRGDVPQAAITQGGGSVKVECWKPGDIRLHANIATKTATILLHQFYFPDWVADGVEFAPTNEGLLSFTLAKGEHEVVITRGDAGGERLGMWVSGVALLLLLTLLSPRRRAGSGYRHSAV